MTGRHLHVIDNAREEMLLDTALLGLGLMRGCRSDLGASASNASLSESLFSTAFAFKFHSLRRILMK
jgi:hypothetical protein